MIRFKQKNYTIEEGHYTGPKDLEEVPGYFEVIGKTTVGGSLAGGAIGGVLNKVGVERASVSEGLSTGGKVGFVSGILLKILLNSLHNPMKTVKFQEVDKMIRAKFGIYRFSGITAGDSFQKRTTVDEKFGFNDRKVTEYKISFCIRNNQVTMYTLGITSEDLEKLNSSLDYYCKKFFGMDYTSKPINVKENSYSVTIVFTNYKAISDFICEVSDRLGYKINLLDDDALVVMNNNTKTFSKITLDKYDTLRILGNSGGSFLSYLSRGPKEAWSGAILEAIITGIDQLKDIEKSKYFPNNQKNFTNSYLEDRLQRLGFIEGMHYTVGMKSKECNVRLNQGLFLISVLKNSKSDLLLAKILPGNQKKEINNQVNFWTIRLENRGEFDILLKNIINSGVIPNIFVG